MLHFLVYVWFLFFFLFFKIPLHFSWSNHSYKSLHFLLFHFWKTIFVKMQHSEFPENLIIKKIMTKEKMCCRGPLPCTCCTTADTSFHSTRFLKTEMAGVRGDDDAAAWTCKTQSRMRLCRCDKTVKPESQDLMIGERAHEELETNLVIKRNYCSLNTECLFTMIVQ